MIEKKKEKGKKGRKYGIVYGKVGALKKKRKKKV